MLSFPEPDVEQYFQTYVIRQFSISQDEKRLVFSTNLNGHFNLWAMDLPHTYPYPLTYVNEDCSFIYQEREAGFILAGFDQDGDENYHLYALPVEGGVPSKIVDGDATDKFFFVHLSADGERLYYMTSKGNPQFLNTHCLNLKTGEDRLIVEGQDGLTFTERVSPNEQQIVLRRMYSSTYSLGFVQQGDELIAITPVREEEHVVFDVHYVDEETLLFVTDYGAPFSYVASFHIPTRKFEPFYQLESEEVTALHWHKESKRLFVVTARGVEDRFYALSWETKELEAIPLPVDVVEQVEVAASGCIYLLGRGATETFNIYRYQEGEWQPLTQNRLIGLDKDKLVEPEVVTYTSFDGMEIEALLFRAKPEVANGHTIFWPHGGPQAAERKFFRAMFQYFLANGYHIFAPNFRGSTGYGSNFMKLVEGDWGEGPRLDCVAGIEWLFAEGIATRDRLFVVGGSYGGYMTLLLAGRHADYFRAAIDIFGVSNLFTFIDSVPAHWQPLMARWLGDPVKDRERLIKDSPITYLDQMVKPILIIQGANDPRVVKAESDQIVEALRQKGVEVEYLVLDDEGHGFSRKENEVLVYQRMVQFLQRHHGA